MGANYCSKAIMEELAINGNNVNFRTAELIPDPLSYVLPNKMKFSVPPYYEYKHRETIWLLARISDNNWKPIKKLIERNPKYLTNAYFQIPDIPPKGEKPMFHRFAVLYLTPFAIALYMKALTVVEEMVKLVYQNDSSRKIIPWNAVYYVANLVDRTERESDLHVIYAYTIILRREFYAGVRHLLNLNWQPHAEVILPYRRPYLFFNYHYRDFVDYSLAQLYDNPNMYLPALFKALIDANHVNFSIMTYEKVKIIYNDNDITDWVSIPRRLLRYIYYVDRSLLKISNCILTVSLIQQKKFFWGNSTCMSIDIDSRLKALHTDEQVVTELVRYHRIIFDQDCCIALLLVIYHKALNEKFAQVAFKVGKLLIQILGDTQWLLIFLCLNPTFIAKYFNNLTENVETPPDTIKTLMLMVPPIIDAGELNASALSDLRTPGGINHGDWRQALVRFKEEFGDRLGRQSATSVAVNSTSIVSGVSSKSGNAFSSKQTTTLK